MTANPQVRQNGRAMPISLKSVLVFLMRLPVIGLRSGIARRPVSALSEHLIRDAGLEGPLQTGDGFDQRWHRELREQMEHQRCLARQVKAGQSGR
ncbi:hypothetical protein SAMN05444272_3289 [Roseibium suaedae]|uniref:Uncharacterized protein n=2 Tax=Roseibium suaedae TaxID=735517 RepID=A0A1M7M785_9HYPH|nr:hypothetical protein SAMN05444272_3289 [Roseibium suaedae]